MKYAILFAVIFGIFASVSEAGAQELGLNVVPASPSTDGREALVMTYTKLVDTEVQLFEADLPATTQAACLASRDFTGAVPIPPDRVRQIYGEGRKVVIVFTKSSGVGPCSVIVGRNGVNLDDFNVIRANFGQSGLLEFPVEKTDADGDGLRQTGHVFRLERHFDN
jgi:hypothetical protein